MKRLLLAVMSFVMMFSLTACSSGFLSEKDMLQVDKDPVATFTLEYDLNDGDGKRVVELEYVLRYNKAPSTVANFVNLANDKYYDGKIIHYASTAQDTDDLSYIIGGQYKLDEEGDILNDRKNYSIKGEFEANKWENNDLKHTLGSLVMDREMGSGAAFDTASSAFYFVLNENNSRDRNYCVFGEIQRSRIKVGDTQYEWGSGLNRMFIDDMNSVKTERKTTKDGGLTLSAVPTSDIVITSVSVETNGVDYSKAKIAKA